MIGGKELDLHVLYVEVTRRGGYEKVNTFVFFFNTQFFLLYGNLLSYSYMLSLF